MASAQMGVQLNSLTKIHQEFLEPQLPVFDSFERCCCISGQVKTWDMWLHGKLGCWLQCFFSSEVSL